MHIFYLYITSEGKGSDNQYTYVRKSLHADLAFNLSWSVCWAKSLIASRT